MKERPILFSAPMVRAILAGAKTRTRRIVKYDVRGPNGPNNPPDIFDWYDAAGKWRGAHRANGDHPSGERCNAMDLCPYGARGDRLWVRESWQPLWATERAPSSMKSPEGWAISYPATDGIQEFRDIDRMRLSTRCKPSIHMPRWASRITLDVTGVRVERLHDITNDDAKAEGAAYRIAPGGDLAGAFSHVDTPIGHRDHFVDLWRSINGAESWDANPWVWVVEFKRIEQQAKEAA